MEKIEIKNRHSWKKDHPDHRDHKYSEKNKVRLSGGAYCNEVDLSPNLQPIQDQLQINSCAANAFETAIGLEYGNILLSRMQLYWRGRSYDNLQMQDNGTYLRSMCKAATDGICKEEFWPYDTSKVFTPPSAEADQNANYKLKSYQRLSDDPKQKLYEICHSLSEGNIITCGITLFPSFEALRGEVYLGPSKNEKPCGFHCVDIIGFNLSQKMGKLRNSWSRGWASQGYCWLPLDYLTNSDFNDDFWSLR